MGEPTVRNTLRVQRAMHDLTQADLAERAGITRASVNAIEAGRMIPSVFLALKIARAMNVSVEDLFSLSSESKLGSDSFGGPPATQLT